MPAKKSSAKRTGAKKTTAKRTAAKSGNGNGRRAGGASSKVLERYSEEGEQVVAAHKKYGGDWGQIARNTNMSVLKAKRLFARATLKPSDKVVVEGRPESEVAKEIVRLRDQEGLPFLPDIWARTGLSLTRLKTLYKKGGGSGARAARTTNGSPRAKRSAKKSTAKGGARRAKRSGDTTARALLEEIWNLDTSTSRVQEILEGHTITVTRTVQGRPLRPTEHRVVKVKTFSEPRDGGRAVAFVDGNQQNRVINFREISGIR